MSTEPNADGTPSAATATPSSSAPISGTPGNGTAPEPWKPGATAPSWAQGRTPEEILNIAAVAVDQLARRNSELGAPPQPQGNRFDLDIGDEDLVSGRQLKEIVQRYGQQSAGDPVARQLAVGANLRAIQQAEADAFRRWGPELQVEISKIPPDMRSLDNLQLVVDIVKSRHVQELVDEQARQKAVQLAQEQVATIRSGTGGSTTIPPTAAIDMQSDALPEQWRRLAQDKGLTVDQVREFCQATGQSVEQYFETVKKYGSGAIVHG